MDRDIWVDSRWIRVGRDVPEDGVPGHSKGAGLVLHGNRVEDCLFCGVQTRSSSTLPWHDRPLMCLPDVGAAIAGLGAFVPGYVLVFPEMHVDSTMRIPDSHQEQFLLFAKSVLREVEGAFGPTTIFEHGSCFISQTRRSACIDHAHLHLVPGNYSLNQGDLGPIQPSSGGIAPSHEEPSQSYLLLAEPGRTVQYFRDPGVSQYFRRKIAAQLGSPDEWDYLLFPRMHNVEQTMRVFNRQVA